MLEKCLAKILEDPNLHASWLNTFSYLEYVGFRKIVKSQDSESMSKLLDMPSRKEDMRYGSNASR
jgi:SPX domain protein involved in polyphosphate accumulation